MSAKITDVDKKRRVSIALAQKFDCLVRNDLRSVARNRLNRPVQAETMLAAVLGRIIANPAKPIIKPGLGLVILSQVPFAAMRCLITGLQQQLR